MSKITPCRIVKDFMALKHDAPMIAQDSLETVMDYIIANKVEELYGTPYTSLLILREFMDELVEYIELKGD